MQARLAMMLLGFFFFFFGNREEKKLVLIIYIATTCMLRSELHLSKLIQYMHDKQLVMACVYNKAWYDQKYCVRN